MNEELANAIREEEAWQVSRFGTSQREDELLLMANDIMDSIIANESE